MDIALKNIKYAAFASEETYCFQASIYIDGIKEGTVGNDGRGGPNNVSPYALEEKINAYAKTLPLVVSDELNDANGEPFTYANDADSIITDLVTNFINQKDLKKLLSNYLVFTLTNASGIYQIKVKDLPKLLTNDKTLEDLKQKNKADKFLNLLPFDDALALYVLELKA